MNLREKLNELARKISKINDGAPDASDAELTKQLEELFYQDLNTFANVLPESIYHAPEHFVNNTKDAIFRYSLQEKRFVFINQAGREITGYTFEELQKSPDTLLELVHPDQREEFIEKWDEMLKGNITYKSKYKIICKDNSIRWVNLRIFQVFNTVNEPIAIEGIVRDITDEKIALEQLRSSEENYRTIFNTIANLIITVDGDGKIIECNNQVESCLGYASDELHGKDFQYLVHPDYQNFAISQHAELLHYGNLLQKEYALQNRDGEKLIVLINAVVLNDSKRIIYSCIDITKRKESEYKVRAESEVNSLLAKLGREALKTNMSIQNVARIVHLATLEFTKSSFGVVSFFNLRNEKEVLIVTNEKGTNESIEVEDDKKLTPIFTAIGEIDKPTILNEANEIREKFTAFGEFHNLICLPIATNDLLVGHILVANKEEDYNDFDFRVVTQVNDIYSFTLLRKIFEIELVEAKEKAELDDKLKTAFLANMSHEIRTPMNGVLGFTNLLSNSELSLDMRAQYIGLIESSTKRLLSLLEDILLYSKLESGTVEFKKVKVNFNQVLSILHVDANRKLELMSGKDVSIKINLELPSDECIMETDAELFQKVFYQLLDNAIKFTDTGSIVFGYHYLKKTKEIFFYVQDTGVGIAKAKLPVILERFRQEDDSHTRKFEGTGLGLAITKEIVALLGGELQVESQKNRGSIFCFTLPFVPYKEVEMSSEISIEDLNWKDKCILIVEDEEVNFVLLKAMLDPTRAVIFYAKNGRRALEMIKDNSLIDLVLLDIKLPEINGYEIAKRIRKLNKKIRIIAQTAYYGPEERKKAIDSGCHDFIPKPIVKTKLLKMMHDQFQK